MTQALNLGLLGNNVNASGQLSLTAGVIGTLPIANGGTGATDAPTALANLGGIGSASPTITTPTIATIKSASASPTVFQNSSGTQVGVLCRAWAYYNPITQTLGASFNVSSVTYNSVGNQTINFTNAMTDTNYAVSTGVEGDNGNNYAWTAIVNSTQNVAKSTTAFSVKTVVAGSGGVDNPNMIFSVAIFR